MQRRRAGAMGQGCAGEACEVGERLHYTTTLQQGCTLAAARCMELVGGAVPARSTRFMSEVFCSFLPTFSVDCTVSAREYSRVLTHAGPLAANRWPGRTVPTNRREHNLLLRRAARRGAVRQQLACDGPST